VPYAQIESGADGLYSYELTIDTQADPNHKLRAAIYAGTSEEISSETVTLTYDVLTPQVQQFTFEYLTGDQRDKQTLTGKEFVTKRWIYEYRPGDVMKITCDLVNSQHVERLWLVSTSDQTHQSLELYREDSGTWVGTGTFSDDIHYRPGDFQLTYQMKSDFAQTDEGEYEIPKMPSIPDLPEMPIGDEQMRALLGGVDISINLEVLTQEIANDRATAIMRAKLPDYPELYYDLFVDSEKVDIVDSVETYQREGYTVEIVANATILTRSGVDKDGNPTFETIYLLPNDEGNARARKSGLTTKVTVVNQGLSGASLLSVAGNGIILNQANNNQDAVAAYRGEYSEWIASISELFKPSYEFLNSLIDKHDLEYETTKKINAIASEVEGVEKSDPLLNAMQTKIGLLTDILYSYTNIEKELDQYQAFVEDDSLPKIETLAYNNMAKVVSAGVVGYGIPAIALQSGIAEVFLGDLGDGLAGEYTVSLAKQADAADDVNNGTSPEDVLGDASALIAERAINSGQRVYSSWRDSFEESSQTTVNEKITLELEKVQEVIQAKEDTLMDSQRDTDEKLATFMAAHTEIFLDAFQGSIPTWSYCIMDSSGYVYEAVTSNRISNVLVKTYQPDGKGNWNLWETTGYTQENPIHTDVTGRYLLFLPNDSFQVAFEKEGYLAETIQVSDQTRTRLIDNIALHSQSAPKVVSATLTDEYVLVQFDRYVDVDTASDFMSVNGIKLAAEPVSPEPSGFEADKMYARSFIGMLDSKEQISAQIGSDYKLEVSDTALSYANVQIQPYEQTLKCQPVIKSIDITPPTYLVVGEETILNVKLTSDHDLTGFEFNIEPDSDLIEIVSVGEVQADGTTQVVVRALSVEAANLTFSASATTLTLPILAAREDLDQKVIEYAMLSSGVNQINSIIIYGVAAAAVILLGFGIMSVIRARRRRLQPTA
ncbi:MAG: hypothetical protein LBM60_08765, partial [Clostridium sp.]|nr:hypothetical protein [Clostridium sp.]